MVIEPATLFTSKDIFLTMAQKSIKKKQLQKNGKTTLIVLSSIQNFRFKK